MKVKTKNQEQEKKIGSRPVFGSLLSPDGKYVNVTGMLFLADDKLVNDRFGKLERW